MKKKKMKEPDRIDLSEQEVEELEKKILTGKLSSQERQLLVKMLKGFVWLNKMLEAKKISIRKLMRLFGIKTEKKKSGKNDKSPPKGSMGNSSKKGHGRNGHDKYTGAKREYHSHESLKSGDRCPTCERGNLYEIDPGTFVQIKGAPPLQATIHEAQKLRCSTCGDIFTATVPKEIRKQKYDETADVMIALSRYCQGVPHYRLDKWQKYLGVPLPAATQWERVEHLASSIRPVFNHLIKLAASGKVALMDDTKNLILDLKKKIKEEESERTGIFTTGIISKIKGQTINLFFTGNRHAGENLDSILKHRPNNMSSIIKMSDALASNNLKKASSTDCFCITHGRRNFKDAESESKDITEKCNHAIYLLGKIYHYENIANQRNLTDEERLLFHQKKSGPVIKKLRRWMLKMLYLKKVEPNDSTGIAIQYMLNHWKELTQFLRVPAAPIDNTECERLLKRAILHRKNSLFFKTTLGAYVADIIMSLIQTCIGSSKNPFDYLVALHRNKKAVFKSPERFLPWNYQNSIMTSVDLHSYPV